MNINLHIERLILDGLALPHKDRPLLQAALEAELTRLLSDGGIGTGLATGGTVRSISAGSIQLSADSGPNALGTQIAQAVYGGMKR